MSFHFTKPSGLLSAYIKQYWAIEDCLPAGETHIQRIVPNGLTDLMFYLGDTPLSMDENKHLPESTILSGQQKGYYDLLVSGKMSLFSITFQPYGAKSIFNIPSNEFYDQNVPLKYLLRNKTGELEIRLYEAGTFTEKISIVEKFLLDQLRNNKRDYRINRIVNSVSLINQSKGIIDIDALSSSACLCRKQYERCFAEYIGSSPKQFLRIVRFQNTLFEKQKNQNIQLTELALQCGYYDQSHMISEFKLLSGKTPGQYFSECEPYSDYFQ